MRESPKPDVALTGFSLVAGGPLYRLYCRLHLSDADLGCVSRRASAIVLFAWVPLLGLSWMQDLAWGSGAVSFLVDVDAHVRLLVALPLLVTAECTVQDWITDFPRRLLALEILPAAERWRLDAAIASAQRLRDSVWVEMGLVIFVYGIGIAVIWRHLVALDLSTWYSRPMAGGRAITLAGWWYILVSLPMFQFLLSRWYWRLAIWARLLWQVSRMDLQLIPTHPDRAAGLDMVGRLGYGFVPLLLAHGALVAGLIADSILFRGMALPRFMPEFVLLAVLAMLLVVGPVLPFAPGMTRARRAGLVEYDSLAQRYVLDFERKWLSEGRTRESPLGNADIQSLADLCNAYQVVRTMRLVPVSKEMVVQLLITVFSPIAPLILTLLPLDRLAVTLLKAVF